VEGFSKVYLQDMLEEQLRALLRKTQAVGCERAEIVVDPISGWPVGYAYLDFETEEDAELMVAHRTVDLNALDGEGQTRVRMIMEGPRPEGYDPPKD